jgi:DNA (cytosine-5)-methyltransferase 1
MNRSGDYHNEIDPYAAQWIRNLMKAGLIPEGEVDERSITAVSPDEIRGFRRWHFFSGIGGWSLALRLAGWPDDREICTGSAPCQPFSVAGKGKGTDDHRHLWPDFFRIIVSLRPAVCMGEQVHAAARQGWLDGVLADLESIGYAGDALSVPACAVNAPHRRDRLWWCAEDRSIVLGHGHGQGLAQRAMQSGVRSGETGSPEGQDAGDADDAVGIPVVQSGIAAGRRESRGIPSAEDQLSEARQCYGDQPDGSESSGGGDYPDRDDAHAHAHVSGSSEGRQQRSGEFGGSGGAEGDRAWNNADPNTAEWRQIASGRNDVYRTDAERQEITGGLPTHGSWDNCAWIICHDGKARRVGLSESGIRRLADDGRLGFCSPVVRTGIDAEITPLLAQGVKSRVGKLRAFGNMIVPQVAAEMLKAYMSCRP